ncbi:IclR family transcriptional regulator [Nesterenkonia salmonea]|uniref:Glycerol operon regulatory protein n=1 Tax=Nesterenkonia salmonea TaxID=1804987 RepID=A0A5R9B7L1_9MICC|nr:IclR family transcriptional regulator C-terminal domain-containing protein [Nesterenkonia salmonea]TLP93025.1 IclR family transcriptional regulator [Nesterenkonia salmonea]
MTDSGEADVSAPKSEIVRSLASGLDVLEAFTPAEPRLTLAEVARKSAMSRATARRMLLTLVERGYAYTDGRTFELTPRVLSLGHGYWSGRSWHELLQPSLRDVSARLNESCSAAILTGDDVMYVSRVHTRSIMRIDLGLGTRLPAFATSMGRVLLSDLPDAELLPRLQEMSRSAFTSHTRTDPQALLETIRAARNDGCALVDQELEMGLRSAGVPVRDDRGKIVLAINTSMAAGVESLEETKKRVIPALKDCASQVETMVRSLGKDLDSLASASR